MTEQKKSLSDLFDEALNDGETDLGERVFCDICGSEWTGKPDSGGFLFESKAVCPICAPRFMVHIIQSNEQEFIRAECPPEKSFWQWCLWLRNGNNKITMRKLNFT